VSHTDGVQVTHFVDQLAAEDDVDYHFSSRQAFDELIVPLPKMHKEVSTSNIFGVMKDGRFLPYCLEMFSDVPTHSQAASRPTYNKS
jgi:hypothetical protein